MEGICYVQEHLVCVASMVKLLCLVINHPRCGWSEESPRAALKMEAVCSSKTLEDFTISQLKRQSFSLTPNCESFEFVYTLWVILFHKYCILKLVDSNWEVSNDYIIVAPILLMWGSNSEKILLCVVNDVTVPMSKEYLGISHPHCTSSAKNLILTKERTPSIHLPYMIYFGILQI